MVTFCAWRPMRSEKKQISIVSSTTKPSKCAPSVCIGAALDIQFFTWFAALHFIEGQGCWNVFMQYGSPRSTPTFTNNLMYEHSDLGWKMQRCCGPQWAEQTLALATHTTRASKRIRSAEPFKLLYQPNPLSIIFQRNIRLRLSIYSCGGSVKAFLGSVGIMGKFGIHVELPHAELPENKEV